jgi:CRP-like cAMP-binding protein
MASATGRTGNRILDLLPGDETNLLLPSARTVLLPQGHEVFSEDGPMPHVYFPTTAMFGVVILMREGRQVEGTTIGSEGMLGLPVFLALDFHPFSVVSQIPGEALQVPAATFLQTITRGGTLDRILRRYTLYRMRSANQMGACNTLHSVEERMSRWLLMAHDQSGKEEFVLTHESLSECLGVRRQTVSLIAGVLQKAGLITYRRGVLQVVDREGLESASCECYTVLKQLYDRIVR